MAIKTAQSMAKRLGMESKRYLEGPKPLEWRAKPAPELRHARVVCVFGRSVGGSWRGKQGQM